MGARLKCAVPVEISHAAQIFQQQESFARVFRMHLRHMCAGRREQASDVQERAAVLPVRRCVHRDQRRSVCKRNAEIAAKARILRCGSQRARSSGKLPVEPALQLGQARVGTLIGMRIWMHFDTQGEPAGAMGRCAAARDCLMSGIVRF